MPEEQWICDFIAHGRRLGADISKCAALARGSGDMLTMLSAAERMTRGADDGPVLTIAMGADGVLSRLAGGIRRLLPHILQPERGERPRTARL